MKMETKDLDVKEKKFKLDMKFTIKTFNSRGFGLVKEISQDYCFSITNPNPNPNPSPVIFDQPFCKIS